MRAIDDPICGGNIVTLHCCAAALYSDTAHERWARGKTPGLNVLRRRIFMALNAYQRRNLGNVRTPIYLCELDRSKLRRSSKSSHTFYYDGLTVDPRFEALGPPQHKADPPSKAA
jgi:hypothetical protein